MLKKDLIKKVEQLEQDLAKAESNRGTVISDCHIDMSRDEESLMIAEAVKEGMKALQSISLKTSYGIKLDNL